MAEQQKSFSKIVELETQKAYSPIVRRFTGKFEF